MKLKIMEWNINQRNNCRKRDMPIWIADVIKEKEADIIILTECCLKNNWKIIKERAFGEKYMVCESDNSFNEQNDVVIAVNTEKLKVIYEKSFKSEFKVVPDHLEVKCKSIENDNEKELTIIGMRIHSSEGITHKEKEDEFLHVLNDAKENVIIGGDFNNNRRVFQDKDCWHMKRIDEINKEFGYTRETPEGSSIFSDVDSSHAYCFAEDHFIIKGDIKTLQLDEYDKSFVANNTAIYKWGKNFSKWKCKTREGKNIYDYIEPPYPDHAILSAIFEL